MRETLNFSFKSVYLVIYINSSKLADLDPAWLFEEGSRDYYYW